MRIRGSRYCPYEHAESLGIAIVFMRLPENRWGECDCEHGVIRLHKDLNVVECRCTLAHELAHALAGDPPSPFGLIRTRAERRAKCAAAQFLICPIEYACAEECYGPSVAGISWALEVIPEIVVDFRTYVARLSPSRSSADLAIEMSAC